MGGGGRSARAGPGVCVCVLYLNALRNAHMAQQLGREVHKGQHVCNPLHLPLPHTTRSGTPPTHPPAFPTQQASCMWHTTCAWRVECARVCACVVRVCVQAGEREWQALQHEPPVDFSLFTMRGGCTSLAVLPLVGDQRCLGAVVLGDTQPLTPVLTQRWGGRRAACSGGGVEWGGGGQRGRERGLGNGAAG